MNVWIDECEQWVPSNGIDRNLFSWSVQNLLQVSERIPTIGTQLKILSTVKATMFGTYGKTRLNRMSLQCPSTCTDFLPCSLSKSERAMISKRRSTNAWCPLLWSVRVRVSRLAKVDPVNSPTAWKNFCYFLVATWENVFIWYSLAHIAPSGW